MKNNGLKILEQFTRKLANCRYRVSVNSLIDYLSSGKFGYTISAKENKIITNEFVYADDIQLAIKHIKSILAEPKISIKQDMVVQLASIATKTDSLSLNKTIKDEKLWKVNNNEIKPEYVHSYVQEENLATYENRFICFLIDVLFDAVNDKVEELCQNLKTVNGEISKLSSTSAFTLKDYVDYSDDNGKIPVLLSSQDAQVSVITSLIKSKKILTSLRTFDVYKACQKAGKFDGTKVQTTNIFDNEPNYNYCFTFYKKYFNKEVSITTNENMYRSFVEVNLFSAISELNFLPIAENDNVLVNTSSMMKYSNLSFIKAPFTITLNQKEKGVELVIVNDVDKNVSKNFINVSYLNDNTLNDEELQDYLNVYTITTNENLKTENTLVLLPNDVNFKNGIKRLVKSLLFIVEGSEFIYNRYCPICGSSLVAPDASDMCCVSCESVYHLFNYEFKDVIWIKHLKTVAKNETQPSLVEEELAVSEDVEVLPKQRTYISKSFTGKMCQAITEYINYYNELKNYVLKFAKTRSKVSWNYDNFFVGRKSKIKLGFRGNTLVMYIDLPYSEYEGTKYYPKDFSSVKKFEDTPMMVKVKSNRGVKFAKELISVALNDLGDKKDFKEEVYKFSKKTNAQLIKLNLAKEGVM